MIGIIFGFLGMFSGIIITTMIYLGMLGGFIGLIILDVIMILVSLVLLMYQFLSGGVIGVLTSAKLRGNPLALILRNDKQIRFVEAKLREGMAETKKYGRFLIVPDSVYSLPNGVTGVLAYHKYGVSLNPQFVQATTRLREEGVKDIEQVKKMNKDSLDKNSQYVLNLDKNIIEANKKRDETEDANKS